MKQTKPFPQGFKLAPTLATRVFQLREFRNLTVKDLAKLARFTPERVSDIEAGLETWLSVTDRQMLAKALTIDPLRLQEVETRAAPGESLVSAQEAEARAQYTAQKLSEAILNGARDIECPDCRSTLKCSVQEGFDLDGNPIQFAKAFCLKCPFVLR